LRYRRANETNRAPRRDPGAPRRTTIVQATLSAGEQ
jgi:hypothetical protein